MVRGHQLPEALAVAGDAKVSQLVHHDVVEHFWRSEDQAPRERQRSAARRTAPARALVADRDPFRRNAHPRGARGDSFGNRRSSNASQPPFESGTFEGRYDTD